MVAESRTFTIKKAKQVENDWERTLEAKRHADNRRQTMEDLKSELDILRRKTASLVGLSPEDIEACLEQPPVERCLENTKTKYLVAHRVSTGTGTPCFILSSHLYPEVGILTFDTPMSRSSGGHISIIETSEHHRSNYKFSLVCGCCQPHLEGIPMEVRHDEIPNGVAYREFCGGWSPCDEKAEKALRQAFMGAIRQTCADQKITKLLFLSSLEPDLDGLHFMGFWNLKEAVDHWRFAFAFSELKINEHAPPFFNLFGKKPTA